MSMRFPATGDAGEGEPGTPLAVRVSGYRRPSTLFMIRRDSPRREPDLQRSAPCRDVVML